MGITLGRLAKTYNILQKMHQNCAVTHHLNKFIKVVRIKTSNKNKKDKAKDMKENKEERNHEIAKPVSHVEVLRAKSISLIEKMKMINELPGKRKNSSSIPFRQAYRIINDFYLNKIEKIKKDEKEKDIDLIDDLYPFFNKRVGNITLTERRLKEFLFTLFKHQENCKVMMFMRQMGMIDDVRLSLAEQSIYIDALTFSVNFKKF